MHASRFASPLDALERAVEIKGSQSALAQAIGKKQSYVSMLLFRMKKGVARVDLELCPKIEAATECEVTRQDLRPDYPWDSVAPAGASAAAPHAA